MAQAAAGLGAGNVRGIAAMLAAQAGFIVNDTLIKLAVSSLPAGEAIFMRGLFATAFAVALVVTAGGRRLRVARHDVPLVAWRTVGEVGSTFVYLFALFNMPIAEVSAINQFAPLAIVAAGAAFLGERVGWRRWVAALVGFAGVMLVVRPGTGAFTVWSLLALLAVAFTVLRDLVTRRIAMTVPTILISLISSISVSSGALTLAALERWHVPSPAAVGLLACASVFLYAGYFFSIEAMRSGEVAVVSPFRYSSILWAIAIGALVWGELPDGIALAGMALVVGAGVYTFLREQRLRREGLA